MSETKLAGRSPILLWKFWHTRWHEIFLLSTANSSP